MKWFAHGRAALLNEIRDAKLYKEKIHLPNGIILDFREKKWNPVSYNKPGCGLHMKPDQYYLITRHFPDMNKTMEVICGNKIPKYTTAYIELDLQPY